jgi:hypothetical protein
MGEDEPADSPVRWHLRYGPTHMLEIFWEVLLPRNYDYIVVFEKFNLLHIIFPDRADSTINSSYSLSILLEMETLN